MPGRYAKQPSVAASCRRHREGESSSRLLAYRAGLQASGARSGAVASRAAAASRSVMRRAVPPAGDRSHVAARHLSRRYPASWRWTL